MKKMLKSTVSAFTAITMLVCSAVTVSAEYATYEAYGYKSGELVYAKSVPIIEDNTGIDFGLADNKNILYLSKFNGFSLDSLPPFNEENQFIPIDISSDEFKEYVQNAHKMAVGYRDNGDMAYCFIICKVAGIDENGNAVLCDWVPVDFKESVENAPQVIVSEDNFEQEIAVRYGYDYNIFGGCISGGFNRLLIRFDENNNPEIVRTTIFRSDDNKEELCSTVDLYTGESIVVKENPEWSENPDVELPYFIIPRGDATLDGKVDIRDLTSYVQHIVKLYEIPSYANIVADIDGDENISVKDLASIQLYLIGKSDL